MAPHSKAKVVIAGITVVEVVVVVVAASSSSTICSRSLSLNSSKTNG